MAKLNDVNTDFIKDDDMTLTERLAHIAEEKLKKLGIKKKLKLDPDALPKGQKKSEPTPVKRPKNPDQNLDHLA